MEPHRSHFLLHWNVAGHHWKGLFLFKLSQNKFGLRKRKACLHINWCLSHLVNCHDPDWRKPNLSTKYIVLWLPLNQILCSHSYLGFCSTWWQMLEQPVLNILWIMQSCVARILSEINSCPTSHVFSPHYYQNWPTFWKEGGWKRQEIRIIGEGQIVWCLQVRLDPIQMRHLSRAPL